MRLPLNLNATFVKENTSFIIVKISWHFQYHKDSRKFAVANFASIACVPLLMHQVNSGQCKVCQAKHNTLLHIPSAADSSISNTDKEVALKATLPPSLLSNYALESSNNEQVMLSTAVVFICGSDSRRACRALLDCGSQANFVTKKFVEALGSLGLRRQRHGNLDQSCGRNQITIATQFLHRGYRMHRYWSDLVSRQWCRDRKCKRLRGFSFVQEDHCLNAGRHWTASVLYPILEIRDIPSPLSFN